MQLHSEYRSTYRWHEYTGPRQEVVRKAPQTNAVPPSSDIMNDVCHTSKPREENTNNDMRIAEPAMPRRKKYPDIAYRHNEFFTSKNENKAEPRLRDRESSLLKKAISKISTEYRFQFAWPNGHVSRRDAAGCTSASPRKSKSLGALKPSANAIIHRKRIDIGNASELEPLFDEKNNRDEKPEEFNTEYKKKFRPFSELYSEGKITVNKKPSSNKDEPDGSGSSFVNGDNNDSWYREVVELRKKAVEYRSRGWGSDVTNDKFNDIYHKQIELWDQVSRRSSLSALSLASVPHKNFTKREKDEDNNKRSSPTKAERNAENSARLIRDIVRHHLERTTGGSELDGLILSPTREKLEPTIPRKDDDSRGSNKNSPKKISPMKSSSLKRSHQRTAKSPRNVRSQSVGPTTTEPAGEKKSPKRQSRSATVKERKPTTNGHSASRKQRPSSLNTTASSRSKSSSVTSKNEDDTLAKANTKNSLESSKSKVCTKDVRKGVSGADAGKSEPANEEEKEDVPAVDKEEQIYNAEPVVKSPPEPTRVKSPEQILMKSPDPVNWTVPLDTGKTFTVTQNIREDDLGSRPHSEVKAWTPSEIPPPVAQSAPPSLVDIERGHELS
ncbi:nuclear protein MDM1 isoform X2 [Coccinella septempunctata]|uniref:nuclear protein MDM1 isoform X2 n=1 Tax=Coccinella septempunctata TaxID=41139 RepID=UPI001D07A888|nr:nuclear protein MDM1 isoform X2 [Coccinella septempunctata]